MNGRFLLDTNIVVALFAPEVAVQERLAEAAEVFVSSIVLGELYYGARKSGRVRANLARIDQFAARSAVLGCDLETARQYGLVKNGLRARGRPIPENDLWIAAIAQQRELTLVSRDEHFKEPCSSFPSNGQRCEPPVAPPARAGPPIPPHLAATAGADAMQLNERSSSPETPAPPPGNGVARHVGGVFRPSRQHFLAIVPAPPPPGASGRRRSAPGPFAAG
jgi:tRNA(fMet)-specific endonuclease VapC